MPVPGVSGIATAEGVGLALVVEPAGGVDAATETAAVAGVGGGACAGSVMANVLADAAGAIMVLLVASPCVGAATVVVAASRGGCILGAGGAGSKERLPTSFSNKGWVSIKVPGTSSPSGTSGLLKAVQYSTYFARCTGVRGGIFSCHFLGGTTSQKLNHYITGSCNTIVPSIVDIAHLKI